MANRIYFPNSDRTLEAVRGDVVTLVTPSTCAAHWTFYYSSGKSKTCVDKSVEFTMKNSCVVVLRNKDEAVDCVFAVGGVPASLIERYNLETERLRVRNEVKTVVKAEKEQKLQVTRKFVLFNLNMHDFLGADSSLKNGMKLVPYTGDMLPADANTFLEGLACTYLPELLMTNDLVGNNNKLMDRHLEAAGKWPAFMLNFDVIDLEKRWLAADARERGEEYDGRKPLSMSALSAVLWTAILNGLELEVGGTKYRFHVQSAGWAKIAKRRALMVRADLADKANRGKMWNMQNWKRFRDGGVMPNGRKVKGKGLTKSFFYEGLNFSGMTEVIPYEEMLPWWRSAVVIDDLQTVHTRRAWRVDSYENQYETEEEVRQDESDGELYWDDEFDTFMRKRKLAMRLAQCRAAWLKGKGRKQKLPTTGTVTDVWGNTRNWSEIHIVIPVSVFKGWTGYDSWEEYLNLTHTPFGWMQPAANSRTTNGQSLDTLYLGRETLRRMAKRNIMEYNSVVNCEDSFNVEALKLGLRCLALEGFTPERFATAVEQEPTKLAERIVSKVSDWERGKRRETNTYHFVHNGKNQYLAMDAGWVYNQLAGERSEPELGKRGVTVDGVKRTVDEVCCLDMKEGLVVLQRNPAACGLETVMCYNRHMSWAVEGCCYLPAGSDVAATLSGADYDGDQILVSQSRELVAAMKNHVSMPISFETPAQAHDNVAAATFGEMQNSQFQGAAQNAARALLSTNWVDADAVAKFVAGITADMNRLIDQGKDTITLPWAERESRFWSAYMQIAVDAGKYGYALPESWLKHAESFAAEHNILPGWKYTKSPDRVYTQAKTQLELEGKDSSHEEVLKYLCLRYELEMVGEGKDAVVYDPREFLPTVIDGKAVSLVTVKFGSKEVAGWLTEMVDCYALMYTKLGNKLAEIGYDESNNA